jgi:hypothetical protein
MQVQRRYHSHASRRCYSSQRKEKLPNRHGNPARVCGLLLYCSDFAEIAQYARADPAKSNLHDATIRHQIEPSTSHLSLHRTLSDQQ